MLKSEVAALLQQKTGYSAVWISTGKLPKKIIQSTLSATLGPDDQVSGYWPFTASPHDFQSAMTHEDIARLDAYIHVALTAKQAKPG